jgi:hypothetical protein
MPFTKEISFAPTSPLPTFEMDFDDVEDTLDDDLARCATLNRDQPRRDALLGIAGPYLGGLERFGGLDLAGLARLLQERFIHPDDRHNAAPSAREVLDFLARCPEVRVHGYAVHPSRKDYRVSIEGFECDLADVPWHRQQTLRLELACAACDADERVDDGPVLYSRWD